MIDESSFKNRFLELRADRWQDAYEQKILRNIEYVANRDKANQTFDKIKSILVGNENVKLLFELDDLHCKMVSLETDIAYRAGMKDGMELLNILDNSNDFF